MSDTKVLNNDLVTIFEWCHRNELALNINYCKTISFTERVSLFPYKYTINENVFVCVVIIEDLGVILDSRLTFAANIINGTSESVKTLGFAVKK